jgi:CelD/BcsL family acetyltransferase involved in cellulose biosynthesis
MTNKMNDPLGRAVYIKFLLGEFVLGIWKPQMLVVRTSDDQPVVFPPTAQQLTCLSDPKIEGVFCRGTSTTSLSPGVFREGDLLRYLTHIDVLYAVAIGGSFQDYLKTFSSKSRQNLTRAVRRFSEQQGGKTGCEVYTKPEDMAAFHAEALAISRQTYQTRLLHAGLPEGEGFVQEMCALAGNGMARGYLLRDGPRAIAFAWCRGQGDRLTYSIIGYLPTDSQFSPGTILLYHILEDLFTCQKFSVIDFGTGSAQYKTMFSTDKQDVVSVYYFRPTPKNQALVRLHWALFRFSAFVGRWLEEQGIKARLKKMLRGLKSS